MKGSKARTWDLAGRCWVRVDRPSTGFVTLRQVAAAADFLDDTVNVNVSGSAYNFAGASQRLGLDWVHFGRQELDGRERFGSDAAQAWDLANLGAKYLRQVGYMDLIVESVGRVSSGRFVSVPFAEDADDAREAVRDWVFNPGGDGHNVARWLGYFRTLADQGLRVSLTCFVLGDAHYQIRKSGNVGFQTVYQFYWDDDHARYVTNVELLDISNDHELRYLGYFARAVGELLVAVDQGMIEAGYPGGVASVLASLELFNEADNRNVWVVGDWTVDDEGKDELREADAYAPEISALYWANAYTACAAELRAALREGGLEIPFHLPGLWSYTRADDGLITNRSSFAYRMEFLSSLVYRIGVNASEYGYTLAELVAGVDYHWYHKEKPLEDGGTGTRHIGNLVRDVAAIRAVLAERGLPNATVTVMENGVTRARYEPGEDFLPDWADGNGRHFQAFEVWRRLGGALASGADAFGIFCWMSSMTRGESAGGERVLQYFSMGLRQDNLSLDDWPPKMSRPAPSWFAFRRFAERVLPGALRASMVHPDVSDWAADTEPRTTGNVVIIRVMKGLTTYLYLVFVDPWSNLAADREYCLTMSWSSSTTGTVHQVATWPDDTGYDHHGDMGLWEGTAEWPDDELVAQASDLPAELVISPGDGPFLFSSTAPLAWSVSACLPDIPPEKPTSMIRERVS